MASRLASRCLLAWAFFCIVNARPEPSQYSAVDWAINQANGGSKSTPLSDVSFTCSALEIAFGKSSNASVVQPSNSSYDFLEDINYSATCRLPAACIISPKSSTEVSLAIKILAKLRTKFAVRSGGHKDTPGFASVDGSGVLISLSNMDSIAFAKDKSTLNVGPGCRWQAVYETVVPENLIVIGGRVGMVGVAGFLLGSGVSYYTNHYGLGFDNIKRFEIVLGDGRVVNASATKNSDLFKGLRGGATNFGIVTSFELKTYAFGNIYYEARVYDANHTATFLEAFADYQYTGQLDPLSSVTVQMPSTGPVVLLQYAKPVASSSSFDAFKNIPYTTYIPPTNGSLLDLLDIAAAGFATGEIRTYGETFSHKVNGTFMVQAYDIFKAETANLPAGATAIWVPTALAAKAANDNNLLGLAKIPQQWHEWFITWSDSSQDAQIYAISKTITTKLVVAAKSQNVWLPYLFMNTAGTSQKVLESFGTANLQIIKNVAAKYDPGQVFQKYQNDGYLIRKLTR